MSTHVQGAHHHECMSTVTIGGTEYELRPLSADAALRIMDLIADATDELQTVISSAQSWRADFIERNSIDVFMSSFDDPEVAAAIEAAGISREMVAEAGHVRLQVEPDDLQTFAAILPGAWRTLRDPILTACVIVLAPTSEVLDHEDEGNLDEYISGWKRTIRGDATPDELADLLWEVFQHSREQLLGEQGAVGKIMGRLGDIMSSPKPPAKKSPAKRASKSSTRSRQPSAGTAETSS